MGLNYALPALSLRVASTRRDRDRAGDDFTVATQHKNKGILRARGGLGAAGIGSGSVIYTDRTLFTPVGNSAGTVKIAGGFVEAFGGNNRH